MSMTEQVPALPHPTANTPRTRTHASFQQQLNSSAAKDNPSDRFSESSAASTMSGGFAAKLRTLLCMGGAGATDSERYVVAGDESVRSEALGTSFARHGYYMDFDSDDEHGLHTDDSAPAWLELDAISEGEEDARTCSSAQPSCTCLQHGGDGGVCLRGLSGRSAPASGGSLESWLNFEFQPATSKIRSAVQAGSMAPCAATRKSGAREYWKRVTGEFGAQSAEF